MNSSDAPVEAESALPASSIWPGISGLLRGFARRLTRRLWPNSLHRRLLIASVGGVTLALAIMMATLSVRMDQSVRAALQASMSTLAARIADDVARGENRLAPAGTDAAQAATRIGAVLARYDLLSGVDRIVLFDDGSRLVAAHGFAVSDAARISLPAPPSLRVSAIDALGPRLISRVLGDDRPVRLVFWEPVAWPGFSGWVMVDRNVSAMASTQVDVVRLMALQTLIAACVLGVILLQLLRPAVRQLHQVSRFVSQLASKPGRQIDLPASTLEIDTLRESINRASRELADASADAHLTRQRYESLIESSLDTILLLDRQGRILEINPAGQAMYGFSRDDLLGTSAERLVPPEHADGFRDLFTRLWATGELSIEGRRIRAQGMRRDGSAFPIEMNLARIGTDDNVTLVATIRDRSKNEAETEIMRRAKEQAEEMARARSLFVAQLGHEVRTPLNGIVGATALALATNPSPVLREYLQASESCAGQLSRIIDDLLDVSRIEAGRIQIEVIAFSPRVLLNELAASYEPIAQRKGLQFELDCPAELPAVILGDPTRIRQVLDNLLSNAFKFTSKGSVTLSCTASSAEQGRIALDFAVVDTGPGVPDDAHERIFDAFEQGGSAVFRGHGGSGLGLGLAREMARLMGGLLWLDARVGKGSTFRFTLALQQADAIQHQAYDEACRQAQAGTALAARYGRLQVLVADDNEINRMVLDRVLSAQGFDVQCVADGRDAARACRVQRFDLALIDLAMPHIDGLSLIHELNLPEASANRPRWILALSASADPADRDHCLQAGADMFAAKPLVPAELVTRLTMLLAGESTRSVRADVVTATARAEFDPDFVRASVGNDESVYARLLELACERVPLTRRDALLAQHRHDEAGLALALHELANSLGALGAVEPAAQAREAETLLRHGGVLARAALEELIAAVLRVEKAVAVERDRIAEKAFSA